MSRRPITVNVGTIDSMKQIFSGRGGRTSTKPVMNSNSVMRVPPPTQASSVSMRESCKPGAMKAIREMVLR